MYENTVWQKCVDLDTKAGNLLWQMPTDCTTEVQWEHQSNKQFKYFNFSLKLVTVADETTVPGREFQTLMTNKQFEKILE